MNDMRRHLALAFFALFVSCKVDFCVPDPPPSPTTFCWSAAEPADAGDAGPSTCARGNEHEPNDRPSQANRVDAATCSAQRLEGSVADDVDTFRTTGRKCDGQLPTARVASTDDALLEICMFVSCRFGRTGIATCEGHPENAGGWHLPGGMVGCCHSGPGELHVNATCDSEYQVVQTSAPELDAFITVRRTSGTACVPYTVEYHF